MSLPYQRTSESTRSSASSYFAGSHTPPTSHSSPTWKGSKKAARVNTRRLLQYLGAIAGTVLVFSLISGLFGNSKIRYDVGPSRDGRLNKTNNPSLYSHLVDFEGALDCRISSTELYVPPKHDTPAARKAFPYCKDRKTLLDALNSGGRHGFDEPFTPKGCHYKWYSPFEICMIMDRFDGFIFVGDEMIHNIYAAFNVLLRQDMSLGAMESWKMSEKERNECRCEKQFTNPECRQYMVKNSRSVQLAHFENGYKDPYVCNRIPHFYFDVRGSPAPDEHKKEFQDLLDADPHSWKPVATVHSLGLSTGFDWSQATNSLDEWLTIADNSGRNTPFLWLNPNAAGHLKPPAKIMQEGNNALWHYTIEMGKESIYRGIEHLDMYNNTLQATSWDGTSYGERVSLVQAMEIINWFARLETT